MPPAAPSAETAEVLARFTVRPEYGPVPIWWWSGATLDSTRLRWQLEQLTDQGVHNAVVMCLAPKGPLYGSLADDPPFATEAWWDIFLAACEDAADLGFRFWLYDQLGFSGANFQGQLTARRPEFAGQELARLDLELAAGEASTLRPPAGGRTVGGWLSRPGEAPVVVEPDADGAVTAPAGAGPGRLNLCYARTHGFDYYDADGCAELIDMVLGEFARRAQKWFGSVIVGLFQDELPQLPSWGKDFAAGFRVAYGYELADSIGALFEGDDERSAQVRRDYHAYRAAAAKRAFFDPYAAWAGDAGLVAGFDQQTPAREGDPAGTVAVYGDYLGSHAGYSAPGSDHWGDPKIHSSLAHAHGHERTWIEAFHSSGWGGTLEETWDWLGPFLRRGANLYDPHAVYYSTVGGWWEWAPPSTCWRQPYWPDYHLFADAVSRVCSLLTGGRLVADTVLMFPTSTVQSDVRLTGPGAAALRATDSYNRLNGSTCWFDPHDGVLDAAGLDYEILDEAMLLAAENDTDPLGALCRVGAGEFRTIVLPGVTALDVATAGRLADFADAGGTVLCAQIVPDLFLQGPGADEGGAQRFRDAAAAGRIRLVEDLDDVPQFVTRGPLTVTADVPCQLRRYDDGSVVLLLTAHDDETGTVIHWTPADGEHLGFFENGYWRSMSEQGYAFTGVGDRAAHVRVTGPTGYVAQRWDPWTGDRVDLRTDADGALVVPFADGPNAIVVLGPQLPAATRTDPDGEADVTLLDAGWTVEASSTLDNRWGDLGDPSDTSTLPIAVWRLQHATSATDHTDEPDEGWVDGWVDVHAGVGPFVRVTGPRPDRPQPGDDSVDWRPWSYSPATGIPQDPIHEPTLGPKGTVPEEFIAFAGVTPGSWVAVGAALELPVGSGRSLVVGADADRVVVLDGTLADVQGDGYWSASPLPDGATRVELEIWLRATTVNGSRGAAPGAGLRASFAVVTDLDTYRRPEWLQLDGAAPAGRTTVEFAYSVDLDRIPEQATVQVGSEGPCSILVNGVELGRQGAFEPYSTRRQPQVMPYDAGPALRAGGNEIVVRIDDPGGTAAAFVDSLPVDAGGLGVLSGPGWTGTRDGVATDVRLRREQWLDPRWACLYGRPHPLPRAAWLDPAVRSGGVVLDVLPDAYGGRSGTGERVERLRFPAPAGTHTLHVASDLEFTASLDGQELSVRSGPTATITFDAPVPPGSTVQLSFTTDGGRRGGGLLRGPVTAEVGEVAAPLTDWEALGLRALGGAVTYRRRVDVPDVPDGAAQSASLDLGEVRGTATVTVNGTVVGTRVTGPYRFDVGAALRQGRNDLEVTVRGTLAGYLDDASPTPAIARGQIRHGLFGPVRLLSHLTDRPRGRTDGE